MKRLLEKLDSRTVTDYTPFELGFLVRVAALLSGYKRLGRWPAIEGAEWLDQLNS